MIIDKILNIWHFTAPVHRDCWESSNIAVEDLSKFPSSLAAGFQSLGEKTSKDLPIQAVHPAFKFTTFKRISPFKKLQLGKYRKRLLSFTSYDY